MPLESLRGREVVVVGGAGGIGSAVTELLVEEGARVVVSYRSNRERALRWEGRAEIVQADLASAEERRRLLDRAPSLYGLVVMAGEPARPAGVDEFEASLERSYRENCTGPILLARDAAARIKSSGREGAIVMLSTMQANALFCGSTAYAAGKAALQYAARILAKEYRGTASVRVNVVSPGITAAGMAESSIASGKYDRYLAEGTIARFGRPDDVARAVRFLLEPDCYVTGQILCVDGGITL